MDLRRLRTRTEGYDIWGTADVRDLLTYLAQSGQRQDLFKLKAMFDETAYVGKIPNEEQFYALRYAYHGLYEFRTRNYRVFCFFDDTSLICTNYQLKDADSSDRRELDRAMGIWQRYNEERK